MIADLEILYNRESNRHFIYNKITGLRTSISYAGQNSIEKIMDDPNRVDFFNLKEMNQYVKDTTMIAAGKVPKPTPSCHKFFADE